MTRLAVVVLAGGEGRRMGGGKALRTLHGESLIARALAAARAFSGVLAVAVRTPDQVAGVEAELLLDDPALGGPLAGLASALAFAERQERDELLTLPCDVATIPADLVVRLRAAIGGRGAAIPSSLGRLHPTCSLWRAAEARAALPAYLVTGRRSLIGLAERIGFVEVVWAGGADPFLNLNTAEDLAAAEATVE